MEGWRVELRCNQLSVEKEVNQTRSTQPQLQRADGQEGLDIFCEGYRLNEPRLRTPRLERYRNPDAASLGV